MLLFLEITFLIGILVAWWFAKDRKRYAYYPPGPLRIPLLGNLLQLARQSPFPAVAFQNLAKQYGDVVHVKMGLADTISFNSHEAVHDILGHENAQGRQTKALEFIWERNFQTNIAGIVFGNENKWQSLRRFSIRTLRDFGFGKAACMDAVINEEFQKFFAHLNSLSAKAPDGVIEVNGMFDLTVTNILWRLMTGVNYDLRDPEMLRLVKLNSEMFESTNFGFDITMAYPFLWHMFPNQFGKKEQLIQLHALYDFIKDSIRRHREAGMYASNPECYVDAFLAKIDETAKNPDSEYTDEQLQLCVLDLFQAGSETSSRSLDFCMLYMMLNEDVQEKAQREIADNVTADEPITLSMRNKLPYTHAALLESIRFASVIPLPPFRRATEDFRYKGYLIKKDTTLMVNIQAAHFCKDAWEDPYNFRPERFLTSEGIVDAKIAGNLLTFGGGKRVCLGQQLAETTLFLYFASLLKNFQFLKVPGTPDPSVQPRVGISNSPQPFQVKVVPRQ